MPMQNKYPFNFKWGKYTNQELIKEALTDELFIYDREDIVELVRELALRLSFLDKARQETSID